jgi:outer membrane protein TolC
VRAAVLGIIALLGMPACAAGAVARFELGYREAVKAGLERSEDLAAGKRELEGARQKSLGTAGGLLLPRLSLDGSWRYAAEVPEFTPLPGRPPVKLGDNENWSVGPSVTWNAFDWGASWMAWRSSVLRRSAREAEVEGLRRQAELGTALSYFAVQMAAEQVGLVADSLKVTQAQYRDVELRAQSGSASRIDLLQAHQEVLARRRMLASARAELGGALQDLFARTGRGGDSDTSLPMDEKSAAAMPADVAAPTLIVALDPLDSALAELSGYALRGPDPGHPAVLVQERMAAASRAAATGLLASHLPRLSLSGRISRDYPNGPELVEFTQKAAGVSVSMPLFEGGRTFRDEWELRESAAAQEERAGKARRDLARDWRKASERLSLLKEQAGINETASRETGELAGLVYEAYRAGGARFIEVEATNLKAMEARVQEVRTRVEMLGQLAVLKSLAGEGKR